MNTLSGVSALTPSAAQAVGGNYAEGGPVSSLIESWDGTSWQIATSAGDGFLTGVAAITPSDVWAVGSVSASNTAYATPNVLIEHWNGTQWTIVPAANTGSASATLKSVIARASNDVWAVGGSEASPLVERWDGATWQIASSPDTAGSLSGVAAVGPHDVRAVGHIFSDGRNPPPLAQQWDGVTWRAVSMPTPNAASGAQLSSIATDSAGNYWAVGSARNADHVLQTLTVHCP